MFLPLLIAALAGASIAAPQPRSLQKRSFHVASNGRGLSARQEIARTHRKYGWEIIAAEPETVETSTVVVTLSVTSGATAPAATGYGSPTAANSTSSTSSGAASTPTGDPGSEDGEVTATPEENESEYLSPVTVGGQKLNLNFDTGSADL